MFVEVTGENLVGEAFLSPVALTLKVIDIFSFLT